jgi:methylated-DNA-protein-cysteine methyltransferase-like protein
MPSFSERVIDLALLIPPGRVVTYGGLAKAAGGPPLASRSISSILSKYPNQSVIPWHRIVYAGGKVWLPEGREAERLALYAAEDIVVKNDRIQNFDEVVYHFDE